MSQSIDEVWQAIRQDPRFASHITAWRLIEAAPALWADFPQDAHPDLVAALKARGIEKLYSHQAEAYEAIAGGGKNAVIVTPTASGKTLCAPGRSPSGFRRDAGGSRKTWRAP